MRELESDRWGDDVAQNRSAIAALAVIVVEIE